MPSYVTDGDAQRMFQRSLITYQGRLVYVLGISRRLMTFVDVEAEEVVTADCDLDLIKSPTHAVLGYLNLPDGVVYATRTAARITCAGLSSENIYLRQPEDERQWVRAVRFDFRLFPSIADCLENKYPTFEEAYRRAVLQGIPTAYDQNYAITPDGRIHYRGKYVGRTTGPNEADIQVHAQLRPLLQNRMVHRLNWGDM